MGFLGDSYTYYLDVLYHYYHLYLIFIGESELDVDLAYIIYIEIREKNSSFVQFNGSMDLLLCLLCEGVFLSMHLFQHFSLYLHIFFG